MTTMSNLSRDPTPCDCGAHTQHRVFKYLWSNPPARHIDIARALHTTIGNVKVAIYNIRRRPGISRTCPKCFSSRLFDGACQECGFEAASPILPREISFDEQSPINHLQAGNELGSVLNFRAKGLSDNNGRFTNNGEIVKRWIDRTLDDPLTASVKSDVMNELKRYYPGEAITDLAGKLCVKEVAEYRTNYPLLAASKLLRRQLSIRVMKRLQFIYPFLPRARPQELEG
jgi:hypothetical protein